MRSIPQNSEGNLTLPSIHYDANSAAFARSTCHDCARWQNVILSTLEVALVVFVPAVDVPAAGVGPALAADFFAVSLAGAFAPGFGDPVPVAVASLGALLGACAPTQHHDHLVAAVRAGPADYSISHWQEGKAAPRLAEERAAQAVVWGCSAAELCWAVVTATGRCDSG